VSELAFHDRKGKPQVTLNVTPLIDVLFLLIIFFTLTSTFKRAGELELRLPDSSTAAPHLPDPERHQIEIVVTDDERLFIDDQRVDPRQLAPRLRAVLEEDPAVEVVIKAEEDVRHAEVVKLLDLVRNVGFPGVAIGTELKPPEDASP
jgi:biopolymer transport protein ExbD